MHIHDTSLFHGAFSTYRSAGHDIKFLTCHWWGMFFHNVNHFQFRMCWVSVWLVEISEILLGWVANKTQGEELKSLVGHQKTNFNNARASDGFTCTYFETSCRFWNVCLNSKQQRKLDRVTVTVTTLSTKDRDLKSLMQCCWRPKLSRNLVFWFYSDVTNPARSCHL